MARFFADTQIPEHSVRPHFGMKKILAFLFFLFSFASFSQGGDLEDVYSSDVINPQFNGGGLEKFYEFINQEFDFSKVKKAGKMRVAFTISLDGAVKNAKVLEFNDIESATEILRVLDKAPNWISAKRGGKPFSVEIKLPLEFKKPVPLSIALVPKKLDSIPVSKEEGLGGHAMEKKPEFPGGIQEFYKFIAKNYVNPSGKGLSGKVIVSFVIDTSGEVVDINVISDRGFGTGNEAIRVLKKCPKWIPGQQKGKPVRVQYTIPIALSH